MATLSEILAGLSGQLPQQSFAQTPFTPPVIAPVAPPAGAFDVLTGLEGFAEPIGLSLKESAAKLRETDPEELAIKAKLKGLAAGGLEGISDIGGAISEGVGGVVTGAKQLAETVSERETREAAEAETAATKRKAGEEKVTAALTTQEEQLAQILGLGGGAKQVPVGVATDKPADAKKATEAADKEQAQRLQTLLQGIAKGLLSDPDAPIGQTILRAALGGIEAQGEAKATRAKATLAAKKETRAQETHEQQQLGKFVKLKDGTQGFVRSVDGKAEFEPIDGLGRGEGSAFADERKILDMIQQNGLMRTVFEDQLEHESLQDIALNVQAENPTASSQDVAAEVERRKEAMLMNLLQNNSEFRLRALTSLNNFFGEGTLDASIGDL